ncbi:MAG TPA: alpha-ketoacid dehydrogenase subunit beta [Candidatus Nanoarchaeia archaeon]|nr:alpha-ketoacid dehydrogenase subunit beta [Candidatus Nanoarchaeia archaeon]
MPLRNMVQAINHALQLEMRRDPNVVVLGEDVGVDGGVFRVTDGLLDEFGALRVVDTPLAESGIVGCSIGMAVKGLRPVAEIQFEGFSLPAMDQLFSHAARLRNRSRGSLSVPLVVRMPWGGRVNALEHHSDCPESYFVHTPGLKVVVPSSPYDAKGLLLSAIRDPDPVIFFEPKKLYRAFKQEVPDDDYTIPLGKSSVVREGEDVSILTYGSLVHDALAAAEVLKGDVSVEVVDLRSLSPLDRDGIVHSVVKTGRCLVVHEAPKTLGMGAEIAALVNEKCLFDLQAPVDRLTGFDTVVPLPKLESFYQPSKERIIARVKRLMSA